MWKVVETIQNRATIGYHAQNKADDMSTILEEESVAPLDTTTIEMSLMTYSNVYAPTKVASCLSNRKFRSNERPKDIHHSL
jgi:hypothetical protein